MEKSIYQQICDNIENGILNPDFSLPDEEKGFSPLRFAPGAFDGMCMYHMGHAELDADGMKQMASALKSAAKGDDAGADELFHQWTKNYRAINCIDDLQKYVIGHAKKLNAGNLHHAALSMVLNSRYIESVKIGLELLELFNEPEEPLKEIIRRLGLYDEFTIFSVWNMQKWTNGNSEIFELAKKTHSWGRIHAVERLEPETTEVRHWLLTEGTVNDVVNAYSSLTCWQKSDAESVLFGQPSKEEFKALLTLMEGLLDEGPVPGISELENAESVLLRLLELVPGFALGSDDYDTILSIREWADGEDTALSSVSQACNQVFSSPECTSVIENAVTKGDGLRLAQALNLPFREQLLKCMQDDFDHHYYDVRYLLTDPAFVEPALDLYKQKLPLETMKEDPVDDPCFGDEYQAYEELQFLIQELDRLPMTGVEFIKAALESPVQRNRYRALAVLKSWVQELSAPLSDLSPDLFHTVSALKEREINEENKQTIDALLSGQTKFSEKEDYESEE